MHRMKPILPKADQRFVPRIFDPIHAGVTIILLNCHSIEVPGAPLLQVAGLGQIPLDVT